jgi:spore maturation protein CgeB
MVVVAGNLYPSRVVLLEKLYQRGIPLRIHTRTWPRWLGDRPLRQAVVAREVVRHEKARVFRSAAAVLNNLHPAEMDSVNCRLFEAAGCGALVLCEKRPVLGDLFALESEVLAFAGFDELLEQIRFALDHPSDGERIGDAAAVRAHSDHTYDVRLAELLSALAEH